MTEDKKETENTQEGVSVEVNVSEIQIKTLTEELEKAALENRELKKENENLKKQVEKQGAKIAELTDVKTDSKSNRTENKKGEVKIKFLLSPAGKFLLPYNVGQTVWHPANQADELVDCKYAEYVK